MRNRLVSSFFFLLFLAAQAISAQSAANQSTFEGSVTAILMNSLRVTSDDGTFKIVSIQPDSLILKKRNATMKDIQKGDALGVDAKKDAEGKLTAVSINIFSQELWKRVRKGQFSMASGDIMTNELVDQVAEQGVGNKLVMKIDGESSEISVPKTAEVHKLIDAAFSDIHQKMVVQVRGTLNLDGSLKASNVTFTDN